MTAIDTTPLVEITEKALEVLIRELGLVLHCQIDEVDLGHDTNEAYTPSAAGTTPGVGRVSGTFPNQVQTA